MSVEDLTRAIGKMNLGEEYDKESFKRYCSNEGVRKMRIAAGLGNANCITKIGYGAGQTYTRANPSPELCNECPLYDACVIR
jgi:hypothetical protein